MAGALPLAELLQRPDIWRGDALAASPEEGVKTGFVELDAELPGGGWPLGQLTELLPTCPGIGELSLLQPVLTRFSTAGRWLALVTPPWQPYAASWVEHGIRLPRLAVIEASARDAPWCCEQLLASGDFSAVLAWLDKNTSIHTLRRLQTAAEGKNSLAFLWRSTESAAHPSPASLRLHLSASPAGLSVRILKRRGRPSCRDLIIGVARPEKRHALAGIALPPVAARGDWQLVAS